MPWVIAKTGTAEKPYCVYKEGADKGPTGDTLGCHATEAEAKKQLAALYVNVPDAGGSRSKPMRAVNHGLERRDMLLQDLELRIDGDTGAPTVSGYAAVWDSLSEVLFEWDTGKFRERVARGAFSKTIREQNIPLLVEHADLPLATTKAGTLQLAEDEHGLRFASTLDPADPDVQRIVPKMRRGDMNKMSFGFYPIRDAWDENSKPRTRTLLEGRLADISIVARPAYTATEAKVRKLLADDGLDAESIAELLVRLRQDLPLDEEDMLLMRRLVDTCQVRMQDNTTTVAEAAPGSLTHPAEAVQPVIDRQGAPGFETHPLSYYRERIQAARNISEVKNGPGERTHQAG